MTLKVEGQDDQYWLEEFRKWNEKALAHFYQLHGKGLTFFSSRLLQDVDEARENWVGITLKWLTDLLQFLFSVDFPTMSFR